MNSLPIRRLAHTYLEPGASEAQRAAAAWDLAGTINTLSYLAWALWLIVVGIVVLVRRGERVSVVHAIAVR